MQEQPIEIIHTPGIDISYYFHQIIDFFVSHFPYLMSGGKVFIGYVVGISIVVSVMLLVGIFLCVERLKFIRRREDEIYNAKVDMAYEEEEKANPELLNKWSEITAHMESDNESDWRQAILEADIVLGEILTKEGYQGEGIGEQLRRVDKADFKTLDQAWEAHKVRNLIAHEGSNYPLSKYEARRVINLYHTVFNEFFDF